MLVPNGTRRFMVAQTEPDPTSQMGSQVDLPNAELDQEQPIEQTPQEATGLEDPAGDVEQEMKKQQNAEQNTGQEGDVKQTIFDFLVSLGYPPRRLQEFKAQFVSENGSAHAGTQITCVLPDEVYGKNTQIPREKLKELVQMIEQKHGLSFQDYKRANEQLTLNFMTADAAAQQSLQDSGPGDILDKVYGKPGGGKSNKNKPNPRFAATHREFIKEAKDRQMDTLIKILGEEAVHKLTGAN